MVVEVKMDMRVEVDDAIVDMGVLVNEVDGEEQVQVSEDVVARAFGRERPRIDKVPTGR